MRRESGFALILTIWGLIMLTGLATGFALGTRHELYLGQDTLQELKIDAAVMGAFNYTLLALNRRNTEKRWLANGVVHEVPWGDGITLRARVRSESGKININLARRELIEGLIRQQLPDKSAEQLAGALIDWRDPDDRPVQEGAEVDDYAAVGYEYMPANRPFKSIYELNQVMGFDSESAARLYPYITIFSGKPKIDPMSASPVVLRAIPGIAASDAQSFVEARNQVSPDLNRVPYNLLITGNRYFDRQIDAHTISVDIEVSMDNGVTQIKQLIAQLRQKGYYRIIARGVPEERMAMTY